MRVLVAEDDIVTVLMLQHCLEQFGYDVTTAENGLEALELIRTGQFRLVISDWDMPKMSGLELCREIRRRQSSGYTYLILLTSHEGTQRIVEGLDAGADDFITKPFDPHELLVRMNAGERILSLESRDVTIFTFAKLAESRDKDTGAHLERIREYSRILSAHLEKHGPYVGQIDGDFVQLVYLTSPLHDIGKVAVPDAVLLKPGPLTPAEFEIMKRHASVGWETLDAALRAHPEAKFLRMARDIAGSHHEKFDGTGYPLGRKGDDIPLCGRIVALADVYDALTTKRVYKPAFSHEKAKSIITAGSGTHFDPAVVDAFLDNELEFSAVRENFADDASAEPDAAVLPPSNRKAAAPEPVAAG
jgi:putative two-component system response regulator